VHNDYTEWSGPQRVRDLVPGESRSPAATALRHHQVWRAINKPIQSNPLAIADARQPRSRDLIRAERRYPNAWAKPTVSATTRNTAGSIFRGCGATRRWCQSIRIGQGRPRALPAPQLVRRSDHATGRAAAPEHRGENACVLRFLDCPDRLEGDALRASQGRIAAIGSHGSWGKAMRHIGPARPEPEPLGRREPHIYGKETLADVNAKLEALARELGTELVIVQSNHEGVLIDTLHANIDKADGAIINPAGITHYGFPSTTRSPRCLFRHRGSPVELASGGVAPSLDDRAGRDRYDPGTGLALLHGRSSGVSESRARKARADPSPRSHASSAM